MTNLDSHSHGSKYALKKRESTGRLKKKPRRSKRWGASKPQLHNAWFGGMRTYDSGKRALEITGRFQDTPPPPKKANPPPPPGHTRPPCRGTPPPAPPPRPGAPSTTPPQTLHPPRPPPPPPHLPPNHPNEGVGLPSSFLHGF